MSLVFFLLQLSCWIFLSRWMLRQTRHILPKSYFFAALSYKILLGWSLGLLYVYYYDGGDTFVYYHDASLLAATFWQEPQLYLHALTGERFPDGLIYLMQPRALYFARLASLVSIFSLDNYWLISLSFSIFCFLASWWLVSRLKLFFQLDNWQVFIPFIIYPSVVFWSSGILKESFSTGLIFLLIAFTLQLIYGRQGLNKLVLHLLMILIASVLLWQLKYYIAAVLIPLLVLILSTAAFRKIGFTGKTTFWMVLSSLLIGILVVFGVAHLHDNLHPQLVLAALVKNHDLTIAASVPGNYILFKGLEANLLSFVGHFPEAVFSGLFRPLPWEGSSLLHLLAGIENSLLLFITATAFLCLVNRPQSLMQQPFLWVSCAVYILTLSSMMALASPNFGSLIRYRVAYAPFWLLLMLILLDLSFLKKLFQGRKKM